MKYLLPLLLLFYISNLSAQTREKGIEIGILPTGKYNAITDVAGVKVGHTTIIEADSIRTGATAIIPHNGNIFQDKVPAAIHVSNGFGKLAGSTQVKELGNLETPIVLTNTLNVANAMNALITYTLEQEENLSVRSVNALVGETNDGFLNDIRGRHVKEAHVLEAIKNAKSGEVAEGNVGAGTGTVCFGFKGGIGTSSRKTPESTGGYTVGVLVQTNFGGVLQIDGVPVGVELDQYYLKGKLKDDADGSCMIVVATDAPLDARNLERLAKRAAFGLAKAGGIASNGSGDYVIAFSTAKENRVPYSSETSTTENTLILNDYLSPLFLGAIEATEEAIINSLFAAKTTKGRDGHEIKELPEKEVLELMKKYGKLKDKN
ncbi:P1 family peptidase [Chondrinema litorale]|uniref:DmpA family aminopeptidase n=1 Tax=Chondrinema litorale TaxID=2994555 RepID=UPI002542C4EC|nr:P1 family peptidase [Chondrinema litorale]UZR93036.1 P1 family peptidase [Chondrinema litorale]